MTSETLRLPHLPLDLEHEILSRVPAISLRRLRFTCKRWNALFEDQEFIEKHSDKAPKQYMVLMLSIARLYSMNLNLNGIHDDVPYPQPLLSQNYFYNSEQVKIYKIFHCDGLLLCTLPVDFRLLVWNPCTDQSRWIPRSDYHMSNSVYYLGYVHSKSCRSYKILRYTTRVHPYPFRIVECGIYDLGSQSWRDLYDVTPKCDIGSGGVSLKGNTYWLSSKSVLFSFDFSTERFWEIGQVFPDIGVDFYFTALSVARDDRLSVLYRSSSDPLKIEIWITLDDKIDQTKVLKWRKFLSVDLCKSIPLETFPKDITFFIDEEEKVAVLCDAEYSIHMDTGMVYIVGEENRCIIIHAREYRLPPVRPFLYDYVPSLVQIQ